MLEGLRVLDLTWVLGGPFAGQLMAQPGAEVIKIETLSGDLSHAVPPHWVQGDSAYYLSVNRSKKSIALDLKSEGGRQAFEKLVATSDAVIYGFAPDVPKRLGIDHESLLAINPRICVAELIGLHDEGEYSRAPAYDLIVQAMSGVMSITGAEGGEPARVGYQIGDLSGGLYLALGLTATLAAAQRDGKGRKVQISLLDCQVSLLTWQGRTISLPANPGGARVAQSRPCTKRGLLLRRRPVSCGLPPQVTIFGAISAKSSADPTW